MTDTQDSASYLSWLSSGLKVASDVLDAVKVEIVGSPEPEEDTRGLYLADKQKSRSSSGT
jgi:hypothetical protein